MCESELIRGYLSWIRDSQICNPHSHRGTQSAHVFQSKQFLRKCYNFIVVLTPGQEDDIFHLRDLLECENLGSICNYPSSSRMTDSYQIVGLKRNKC